MLIFKLELRVRRAIRDQNLAIGASYSLSRLEYLGQTDARQHQSHQVHISDKNLAQFFFGFIQIQLFFQRERRDQSVFLKAFDPDPHPDRAVG